MNVECFQHYSSPLIGIRVHCLYHATVLSSVNRHTYSFLWPRSPPESGQPPPKFNTVPPCDAHRQGQIQAVCSLVYVFFTTLLLHPIIDEFTSFGCYLSFSNIQSNPSLLQGWTNMPYSSLVYPRYAGFPRSYQLLLGLFIMLPYFSKFYDELVCITCSTAATTLQQLILLLSPTHQHQATMFTPYVPHCLTLYCNCLLQPPGDLSLS